MAMLRPSALVLLLLSALAHAAGPTENATVSRASVYGSDGKWWKCGAEAFRGCQSGPLDQLGLSREELAYVRGTLDRLPWDRQKTSLQEVAALIGSSPTVTIDKQVFAGVGPGTTPYRGVSVYHYNGYVGMIHWFVQDRFLLVRVNPAAE